MIKAVIIDDSPDIRDLHKSLLQKHFPEISVEGMAESVEAGVKLILSVKPQLVFLDIELKDGTGFQILQQVKPYNFALIFVTAFNDFAIQAIKFSALDYILKPVNEFEFKQAVERALASFESHETSQQITNFFEHYERQAQAKKIILKTTQDIHLVDISDIAYCKSDNTYTSFYLASGQRIVVSTPLKNYDEMLSDYQFFRPHQSFIVNLNQVTKIDKTDGGFLVMKDGTEIPISQRRKASLLQILDRL
ncbi:MAG: LytTR family DNA-binding domain-containing protein [Bacteroidota bacterium]|nr:LytTR family DNA-binding domain-containing protein [Bacteroidota bacterium]